MDQPVLPLSDRHPKGAHQLMLAAERLFGERGVEGVTIRELLAAAGQANKAAVHHYFGSKDGLLEAVRDMRLPELEAARARWQARLPGPGAGKATCYLAALFLPVLEVMDDGELQSYAQFNLRLLHSSNPAPSFSRMAAASPVTRGLVADLHACLPGLSEDQFGARMRLAVGVLLGAASEWERLNAAGDVGAYSSEAVFWTDMLVAAAGVLEAPSAVDAMPMAIAVERPARQVAAAATRARRKPARRTPAGKTSAAKAPAAKTRR